MRRTLGVGVLLTFVFIASCASSDQSERDLAFGAWCQYVIERDSLASYPVDECVSDLINEASYGLTVPETPEKLRQYITLEQLIRRKCERDGALYSSLDECTSAVASSLAAAISTTGQSSINLLVDLGLAVGALTESPNGCGSTWVINGDTYNDPWGIDYKNDRNDCYGDGR